MPEVLAAGDPGRLDDRALAEMSGQRRSDPADRSGVVAQQRQRLLVDDLGFFGAPGGHTLSLHDPFDRREHLVADEIRVRAHAQGEHRVVADHVRLGADPDRPDRDHRGLERVDLTGGDRLQPQDHRRGQHRRVDRELGRGAVAAPTVQGDPEHVGAGHRRARALQDPPRRSRRGVLPEGDVRGAETLEEVVVDHRLGAAADLLGGLEHRQQPTRPLAASGQQLVGGTQQPGDMQVVPARVGDTDVVAIGIGAPRRARVGEPGLLGDGQRVHVGPAQHGRTVAVLEHPDHPGASHVAGHGEAERLEPVGHDPGGAVLLERQLGVGVQVLVQGPQLGEGRGGQRRHGGQSRTNPARVRPEPSSDRRRISPAGRPAPARRRVRGS